MTLAPGMRMRVTMVVVSLAGASAIAQSDPGKAAFLAWGRQALLPLTSVGPDTPETDLRRLNSLIGNADVVALSEADHGIAEPLEFRNRLFRHLVEELGFTAIAIESGITEGRVVHDYVRGEPGEPAEVLAQGISWTFDRLPQNAELVEWMRAYNADPRHARKISFYGFDLPGSPGNLDANRGMRTALDAALQYVETVDHAAAVRLRARVDRWLLHIRLGRRAGAGPQYTDLSAAERDALTAAVADLVTTFEHRQERYTQASSPVEYEWAYRSALGARAADAWLRKAALDEAAGGGFREALEVRDRMQADNLRWIVEQQPPGGKVLVFGAWIHIMTTPLPYWGSGSVKTDTAVAGTYLRRHFGDRLVTIGNLFRKGTWYCGDTAIMREEAVEGSLSHTLGTLGRPLFLLDLRIAPRNVRAWLDREHVVSDAYPWGRYEINPARGFDVLLYMDDVTPACPR